MFYRNELKTKQTKTKEYKFNLFDEFKNLDDSKQDCGSTKGIYNYITENGALKSGYGFSELKMPQSTTDLDNESLVEIRGNDVKAIWKLKWYDSVADRNNYYLFYFNDEGLICYDNLFMTRLATVIIKNDFTQTPYATYYRQDDQDALLLSGEGGNLMLVTGNGIESSETAPIIKSCCSHYGKLFAITASTSSTLVYNEDNDVLNWTDEKTKDLDFSDERGDLNKIISFNDYIYIFRDYGITKLSIYSSDEEFAVSHMYLADSYIYPNTIAQSGDEVLFLNKSGLKSFNGSSVKNVYVSCANLLKTCQQPYAFATAFEGKYYLACRCDYGDGQKIGCENYEGGYKNNTLIVYDIQSEHTDIVRGVDINQVLALVNPYKSKLVACFNNEHKGKIGELKEDGKIFEESLPTLWESVTCDFGQAGTKKRIYAFTIKTSGDVNVVIKSENLQRTYKVKGKDKLQKINTNVYGNQFNVKIVSQGSDYITSFVLFAREVK